MKLQVIKPRFGYMAVSEELILPGRHWWIHPETEHLGFAEEPLKSPYLRIIATDTSFKMEGIPQFEFENKEIEDVKNLCYKEFGYTKSTISNAHTGGNVLDGFIAGYKAAQSKGCFTQEDMRKAMEEGYKHCTDSAMDYEDRFKRLIDSLKQPKKLVAIEVEESFKKPSETAIADEMKTSGNINNIPLVQIPKITKSEEYPDGLLTIKQYFYE